MIVNIKNKEDLITLDFRIKQLRYLKDYKNKGELIFKDFNQATNDSLIYLFEKSSKENFLTTLKDFLNDELNIGVFIKDLKVLNDLRDL